MLDPLGRGAIIGLSALCVVGAFALAPIRARPSPQQPRMQPVLNAGGFASQAIAIVPVRRDPFAEPAAGIPPGSDGPALAQPASESAASATLQAKPDTIGTLPANLSGDAIPAVPGTASDASGDHPRVTAIVTGAHPYAMLETGTFHEIKGIGDRVLGSPIVAIDLAGVRLQNGDRLAVDAEDAAR